VERAAVCPREMIRIAVGLFNLEVTAAASLRELLR
jgi:hypothetical protein